MEYFRPISSTNSWTSEIRRILSKLTVFSILTQREITKTLTQVDYHAVERISLEKVSFRNLSQQSILNAIITKLFICVGPLSHCHNILNSKWAYLYTTCCLMKDERLIIMR